MGTLEVQPGTLLVSANWARSMEEHSRITRDQLFDTELQLLYAEEEKRQFAQQAANAQLDAEQRLKTQQTDAIQQADVKWKRYFKVLSLAVLGAAALLGLVVLKHWQEIEKWFQ